MLGKLQQHQLLETSREQRTELHDNWDSCTPNRESTMSARPKPQSQHMLREIETNGDRLLDNFPEQWRFILLNGELNEGVINPLQT